MNDPIVVDYETYYSQDYTLSKMTTEAYIRDPRFEVILCGFLDTATGRKWWVDGPEVAQAIRDYQLDGRPVLAHHAHFDGLIMSHHHRTYPRIWLDTLAMSRAINGTKGGNGLAACAKRYNLAAKGTAVLEAKGKRRADFTKQELMQYGAYCMNDCEIEWDLFQILMPHFSLSELKLIDKLTRTFTEPVLQLDVSLLQQYSALLASSKASILKDAGVDVTTVMSADKFAAALEFLGVDPPVKWSLKQKKWVYAFAKTDKAMEELAEHDDEAVQLLVAARLQNKTTIAETRANRMVDMQQRGGACLYYKYCGAEKTLRVAGGDKMNWQNLTRGSILRKAVMAPPGHVIVVGDSSNIEARILDTLAGQEDMVQAYRDYDAGIGPDIYCVMAGLIYQRVITKADEEERKAGKVVKLASGYGIGPEKTVRTFRTQAKKIITLDEGTEFNKVYRRSHTQVLRLWARGEQALWHILRKQHDLAVDQRGIIVTCEDGLLLPNGLKIRYPDLKYHGAKDFSDPDKPSGFSYWDGKMDVYIYGAKVIENICQALARIVVMDQIVVVPYRFVLTSHDEGGWCVKESKAQQCADEVLAALRVPPTWFPELPVNAEVGYHQSYGLAKK